MTYFTENELICPKCKSNNTIETTLGEYCEDCGFGKHYHYWNHDEPNFIRAQQEIEEDEEDIYSF